MKDLARQKPICAPNLSEREVSKNHRIPKIRRERERRRGERK
jgi:hypothetical protein